ncbi:MAG TPA: sugar phosphate isomerase/epimerase [Caldilineaceae bacterium]|nr:sugar phosphate isomerase/epimerase [Caldilineaceae bacterium]
MHIGAISTVFIQLPLAEAAAKMQRLGLKSIEIGTGGYFPKNHCDPAQLLAEPAALEQFKATLARAELNLSAFAMHGQPLHPNQAIARQYDQDFRATCQLAEKLGVTRITLLSGVPEAAPGDQEPNWILYPFPARFLEILNWQWEERLIPYWTEHGKFAEDHGVRLCFEMHAGEMVFKPETLLRLRSIVGPVIGCNLDPSHLFWQGMDILEVIRALGREVIYHVHAKDSRLDAHNVRLNGILDAKDFQAIADRSWIFRTVGYGHDDLFWRDFVSALRMIGYDDVLSIEHEDPLIDPEEGFEQAVATLQRVLIRKPPTKLWYE